MLRHLATLVIRHALAHRLGDTQQLVGKAQYDVSATGRLVLGQLGVREQPAGALDLRAHGAAIV